MVRAFFDPEQAGLGRESGKSAGSLRAMGSAGPVIACYVRGHGHFADSLWQQTGTGDLMPLSISQ
jgi:hypothetical protein